MRCAYNNKYLVARELPEKNRDEYSTEGEEGLPKVSFLFDMADEPEEDLSKLSCTLFRIRVKKSDYVGSLRGLGRHRRVR